MALVSEAKKNAQWSLTRSLLPDTNGDGYLDLDEIYHLLQQQLNRVPSEEEVMMVMQQFDADHDGRVTFMEYVDISPEIPLSIVSCIHDPGMVLGTWTLSVARGGVSISKKRESIAMRALCCSSRWQHDSITPKAGPGRKEPCCTTLKPSIRIATPTVTPILTLTPVSTLFPTLCPYTMHESV